jgi:tetratricopeptide (TPR) repeat protein
MRHHRLIAAFVAPALLLALSSCTRPPSLDKEYSYREGRLDSERSARLIALETAKGVMLEELALYLEGLEEFEGSGLSRESIKAVAAGLAEAEVTAGTREGSFLKIRARIGADPDELGKAILSVGRQPLDVRPLEESRNAARVLLMELQSMNSRASAGPGAPGPGELGAYEEAVNMLEGLQFFESGWRMGRLERYGEATGAFTKALELHPQFAPAYKGRGRAYSETGREAEALEDFDRAVELAPEDMAANYYRGALLAELGDYDRAIKDLGKAIELEPGVAEFYNSRGTAYYKLRRYAQSLNDFSKAIELAPDYRDAHFNRGLVHFEVRRYEQALEEFDSAVGLGPEEKNAYHMRGLANTRLGRHEDALRDFDRAIELDPEFAEAFKERGFVYMVVFNDRERACLDWKMACGLGLCTNYNLALHRGVCR